MNEYEKLVATVAMTVICLSAIFWLESSAAKEIALTALGAIGGYTVGVHKDG